MELTLTNDNDLQLQALTKHIRKETFPHDVLIKQLMAVRKQVFITCLEELRIVKENIQKHFHFRKNLRPNHPDMATSYSNIGKIHYHMGEYTKALQISESDLSPDHLNLAWFLNNIGMLYEKMNGYLKARSFYEHAVSIGQRSVTCKSS